MESGIVKQAFKLGNSAGVLLPIEWKGRRVSVKLIERSISQDIIEILEERGLLKNTLGIFLTGSYARGEETGESDIDLLIVTDNINKQIKIDKYEIVLISKESLDKSIISGLYMVSSINEAKAIMNNELLQSYKGKIKLSWVKKHIAEIKSIVKINEIAINSYEEMKGNVSDETLYSVILRLRELYIIECLRNKKNYSSKEFISLVRKVANEESYNAYVRVKNDRKTKKVISCNDAMALIEETKKRVVSIEKWQKELKG